MAENDAKKALREAKEAIVAVHKGRVDQPGSLVFEGVRAYSASKDEVRHATSAVSSRNRPAQG